jgi:hypothetical protein
MFTIEPQGPYNLQVRATLRATRPFVTVLEREASVQRNTVIALALATAFVIAPATASPNSCANVDVIGTFDDVGIHESGLRH